VRVRSVLVAASVALCCGKQSGSLQQQPPGGPYAFTETFTWKGDHAASAGTGSSSSVFWNPDDWDVRGANDFLTGTINSDVGQTGYHVDIVKAASADPTSGAVDPSGTTIGGDGSPGLGIMRVDEQAIVSARLRNPLLIASETQPGIVTFNATRFVTTGHWWEISITPTDVVQGAEAGPVPGDAANCHSDANDCNDGLSGPADGDGSPGPGRRPANQGINLDILGWPDIPLSSDAGNAFRYRFGTKAQIGNTDKTVDVWHAQYGMTLPTTSPDEKDLLYAYRIEYRPSGIDLYADFDKNGTFTFHQHFARPIPWSEVYVHFIALAYQADHHPQACCGFQGTVREMKWRNLGVRPVKYPHTSIAPRDQGTDRVARRTGWMSYDLRDLQRFGPPVNGAPQANDHVFSRVTSMAYTSFDVNWGDAPPGVKTVDLDVTLTADQAAAARARLLYDIKYTGTADVTINGAAIGQLLPATSEPAAANQGIPLSQADFSDMWVHRSIEIASGKLKVGANHLHLDLRGKVQLDRLQLDFGHGQ
jgi:hypothetical protein